MICVYTSYSCYVGEGGNPPFLEIRGQLALHCCKGLVGLWYMSKWDWVTRLR